MKGNVCQGARLCGGCGCRSFCGHFFGALLAASSGASAAGLAAVKDAEITACMLVNAHWMVRVMVRDACSGASMRSSPGQFLLRPIHLAAVGGFRSAYQRCTCTERLEVMLPDGRPDHDATSLPRTWVIKDESHRTGSGDRSGPTNGALKHMLQRLLNHDGVELRQALSILELQRPACSNLQ